MSEAVELTVPVKAELLTIVRFVAATLASQAGFSVEEIEDLRLAADEMCLSLGGGQAITPMHIQFISDDDVIEISCSLVTQTTPRASRDDPEAAWSVAILDALVDEHGRETHQGERRAWLRKRRTRSIV